MQGILSEKHLSNSKFSTNMNNTNPESNNAAANVVQFQQTMVESMPMVPEQEFENLKTLTFQIEKEATETIEKKDGHIKSLLEEIAYLKESHRVDMEEQKLQNELKITDYEMKLKRQQERLNIFEARSDFEDILQTYNAQMCNLEQENNVLLQEVKRVCKIDSLTTKLKNDLAQKNVPSGNKLTCEQVQTYERVIKQLKGSNRTMITQMHKA